ncbi:uncharacterized protein LOC133518416 isoform X2 [Cydia pomonella]|nr:uncharacterized protein LOC133518416 isoform X2 [Cydia pomonella]XP_061708079.1 uncharacterized protein LOC133518416 isoform X2 [Cydia pomonella]
MLSPNSLDYNCWKCILDYLSVREIVTTAKVCRHLHDVAQRYLQEDLKLRIETITNIWEMDSDRSNCRTMVLTVNDDYFLHDELLNDDTYFNTLCSKWGRSVQELVYDAKNVDEDSLWDLAIQCPNIQDITFVRLSWQFPSCDWATNFTKLKRVCFENSSVHDSCVSQLIKNNAIEELVFRLTNSVTGSFFLNVKENLENCSALAKLNTLIINNCSDLDLRHLLYAVEPENYLPELENLTLDGVQLVLKNKNIMADVIRQSAFLKAPRCPRLPVQPDSDNPVPLPVQEVYYLPFRPQEDEIEFYFNLLHFGPPFQ